MDNQILLTTRIRLARNFKGFPFVPTIGREEVEEAKSLLYHSLDGDQRPWYYHELKYLSKQEILYAMEENLISPQLMKNREISSYYTSQEGEVIQFMEEDHLRASCLRKGSHLKEEYRHLKGILSLIEEAIPFSFHKKMGYLTTSPTNVGTGLRASSMLHLPALARSGMGPIHKSATRMGFVLRGMKGEGSEAMGHLYQISNERTLGLTEEEFIQRADSLSQELMELELRKRKELYLDHLIELEDMVHRSYGILRNARMLDYREALDHLSYVLLGVELSLLKPKKSFDFYDTVLALAKAHLQQEWGSILDEKSTMIYRANKARALMKEVL
ncbi:MAG: hypothetical protein Q4E76_04810 [Tissierellia bacterium]|nr:hypothetical protein [Tissierellia bacterium]